MAEYVQPKTFLGEIYQVHGYSHAVILPRNAQLVIASGQPSINKIARMPETPREQIIACFENCNVALKAAGVKEGLGVAHKVHCFFTDVKDEPVAMEIWKEMYPDHRPTWMSVGVKDLCVPGMIVEIQAEAHIVS
ncbi:hypothetical protein FANTH_14773 [Fusarium anthophilum]|uniref:Uncharacterized protein n=1 Tax=Fusarium anthophilum TaxID=48485 RepID=A0A8H4YGM7_9HYPO|nr:hypothetical protein FANTH_14773 [Fusarium anthophilum]